MSTSAEERKRRTYAPRVPPDERRAQLLDAALHLVVTLGHSATSMDAIAKQAGVTKPVVYGVFANRTDLLSALLRREQQQALGQLFAVLPADVDPACPGDPGTLITRGVADFLQAVRQAPERWHCIVMPMSDMPAEFHAVRERARADVLQHTEEIARWLLHALDAPAADPQLAAHAIVTLGEMAARLVLTDPDQFHTDRFVTAVRSVLGLIRGP